LNTLLKVPTARNNSCWDGLLVKYLDSGSVEMLSPIAFWTLITSFYAGDNLSIFSGVSGAGFW